MVEFPQKPKNEIPQDIQSLLLVNRTVDDKYNDLPADSMQKIFYQKDFNLDTTIYDLTAADTSLKVLGELLFESGRFDYVIPEDRFLNADKNAFFSSSMSWQEAKELCDLYQTDAVLSMDLFKTHVATELTEESVFDPNEGVFRTAVGAKMAIVYDALFRIYDPQQEKILVREVFQDTLFWENFTPVKQALTETGIAIALDFSATISTGWQSEYRILFDKGSTALKEAAVRIDNGDWATAIEAWQKIASESGSKSEKSKALFNLATACEIQGDIDCAIQYALESYNTAYHPITYQYLELLKSKKKQPKNNSK
jgi:tetratricopeptide (TPR) repeat protein